MSSLTHITEETDPELVDSFFTDFSINAVPTFVVSNDSGEVRDLSGWDESSIRDDLDWLVTS